MEILKYKNTINSLEGVNIYCGTTDELTNLKGRINKLELRLTGLRKIRNENN